MKKTIHNNILSRLVVLLMTLVAVEFSACAQPLAVDRSVDSLRVVGAEWRVDSLDGFVLKRYHFDEGQLFSAAQNLCLIEIPAGSPRRLRFVADSVARPVSELASEVGALAAVNGSYFDMRSGAPICYLRIGGRQLGENIPNVGDSVRRKYYQHATLTLRQGLPLIVTPDTNRFWEDSLDCRNVMTAGPMLLKSGALVPQRDDRTFVTHRHNRTAIGLRPDGTVVILAVDGRFRHRSEGFTLNELQLVMKWLGCVDAINLDGGGSTTMFVAGQDSNGVVNYPSDNNRYDHQGERPVANAVIII
ncbi:MAG: phosphodiester glycosidase family protein [Bacteroidales bacterium]|nr:phosphodiester glycosidase family protein [Bacteroidales bacterium]